MEFKAVKPSELSEGAEFRRFGATAFLAQSAKKPPLYCPPHRRDCVNGISTDSLDLPHTWPSRSDTLADCHFCLRTDAQLQLVIVNEKRSSPLISAGVQSSEGLCYGILGSLRQETSALIATHRRDCANLPLACCACTPDSHRLARPTAHMALAQ